MQTVVKNVSSALDLYQLYRTQENYSEFVLAKWASPKKFREIQEIHHYLNAMSAANSTPADNFQVPEYYQTYNLSAIEPIETPGLDISSIDDGKEYKTQHGQNELIRENPHLVDLVNTINQH